MKDFGELKFILGIEVERNRNKRTITLFQNAKIQRILLQANMAHCKPLMTPMETTVKLSKAMKIGEEKTQNKLLPIPFQKITGSQEHADGRLGAEEARVLVPHQLRKIKP